MPSNCSPRCPTQDHVTYGACLRAKGMRVAYCRSAEGMDATRQRRWDSELQAYRDARRQGIQPEGTSMTKIRQALDTSDRTGTPFGADL